MKIEDFFSADHIPAYIVSGLVVLLALIIWRVIRKLYYKINNNNDKGPSNHLAISLIKYVIILIAAIAILQINGIDITALVASLGIAGAIGALAVQDFLKDVIMGIHITMDKFFVVGDIVKYGDTEGEVILLTLRTTKIRDTVNGHTHAISNRVITEVTVISKQNDIDVPLPYELPIKEVYDFFEGFCKEIVDSIEPVERCAMIGSQEYADSSIKYRVRFFCDPATRFQTRRDVLHKIYEGLEKQGWSVPYNRVVVEDYE